MNALGRKILNILEQFAYLIECFVGYFDTDYMTLIERDQERTQEYRDIIGGNSNERIRENVMDSPDDNTDSNDPFDQEYYLGDRIAMVSNLYGVVCLQVGNSTAFLPTDQAENLAFLLDKAIEESKNPDLPANPETARQYAEYNLLAAQNDE